MNIQFANIEASFQPWRPADGPLDTTLLSLDTETPLIDPDRHWLAPTYVLGAVLTVSRDTFSRESTSKHF